MPADEQANFIKRSLGPAFKDAGIKTKIIIYDHNADKPDYPIFVLNNPKAAKYNDGSAGLPNLAFKTPDGKVVVIALNDSDSDKTFNLKDGNEIFTTSLLSGSVGTFVF